MEKKLLNLLPWEDIFIQFYSFRFTNDDEINSKKTDGIIMDLGLLGERCVWHAFLDFSMTGQQSIFFSSKVWILINFDFLFWKLMISLKNSYQSFHFLPISEFDNSIFFSPKFSPYNPENVRKIWEKLKIQTFKTNKKLQRFKSDIRPIQKFQNKLEIQSKREHKNTNNNIELNGRGN